MNNDALRLVEETQKMYANKGRPNTKFREESEGDSYLNHYGQNLVEVMLKLRPRPLLLQGPTGMGKSTLCRMLSDKVGQPYTAFNAHPGTDMGFLAGMYRPEPTANGISIVWQHGLVTNAIEHGHILLFEEMSRAPQEAVSRLFGLLDDGFRYWPLPERGDGIEVHPEFWFIATSNPPRDGYRTAEIDKALFSRFGGVFDLTRPIIDEPRILREMLDKPTADILMKSAGSLRNKAETYMPTRDLILLGKAISNGLSPNEALNYTLLPKMGPLASAARDVLSDYEFWR